MRQIISTAILISAFCFVTFAQTDENTNDAPKPTLKLIAQFDDSNTEWNKLAVDFLYSELYKNPKAIGLIRIKNDKNFKRRLYLLRRAMAFRNFDVSRATFLIADEQEHDTEVFIAPTCAEMPQCENCIVMRAIDIDKIEKLFKPKTITKRRKRK